MDRSVLIKWMPGLSCSKNIWSKEKNVLFVTPKGSCSKISIFCFGENIVESSPYFCRGKKIMSLWLTLANTLGGQEAHQPQSMGHGWNGRLWHTSTTLELLREKGLTVVNEKSVIYCYQQFTYLYIYNIYIIYRQCSLHCCQQDPFPYQSSVPVHHFLPQNYTPI